MISAQVRVEVQEEIDELLQQSMPALHGSRRLSEIRTRRAAARSARRRRCWCATPSRPRWTRVSTWLSRSPERDHQPPARGELLHAAAPGSSGDAAATRIASYGANGRQPSVPSPTSTVTFRMPARLERRARALRQRRRSARPRTPRRPAARAAPSGSPTRADLQHPLLAGEAAAARGSAPAPTAARSSARRRSAAPRPRRPGAARSRARTGAAAPAPRRAARARSRMPFCCSVSTRRRAVAAVAVALPYSSDHPLHRLEQRVVGEVHVQRRDRDVALGHRSVVGVLAAGPGDGAAADPEDLPAPRDPSSA